MCGITGFIDHLNSTNKEVLEKMTSSMAHRGPDAGNVWLEQKDQYTLGFGHRRLSIIDLSNAGIQPMHFQQLHLILNGEIYNFQEIQSQLIQNGYQFSSKSDTEVILKAFHCWGIKPTLDKLIGMFAIALYDEKSSTVTLIRDRAGVKPLHYYYDENTLIFGSEIRSILAHPKVQRSICNEALSYYFQTGYIPAPFTIFENVFKQEPGSILTYNLKTKQLSTEFYWEYSSFYNKPKLKLSEKELLQQAEELLITSCNYRMVADVPVGVFLSGGYDSATVAALLQTHQTNKINTFTIGFHQKKYNEANDAAKIANYLGTNHHEYYCSPNDARELMQHFGSLFDEPFGDSSAIPTLLVSKMARKQVTVALSADAGDEVFGGYGRYQTILKTHNRFNQTSNIGKQLVGKILHSKFINGLASQLPIYNLQSRLDKIGYIAKANGIGESMFTTGSINTSREVDELLINSKQQIPNKFFTYKKLSKENEFLDALMATDFCTYMVDDILVKVDRCTMAVSLEGREPLIDHRLVEFMAQVPAQYKIRNGVKKYLLKEICHKYIPKSLMDRPKSGFSFPVFEWLKADLSEFIEMYLNKSYIENQGIFNWLTINKLIKSYRSGKAINPQKIWLLIAFQLWYKEWID